MTHKILILLICMATPAAAQSLQERMLQAEDARPTTEAGLAPLLEGLKGNGRRTAIRAIGRLERPAMIPLIAPALDDGVGIRAEAANALDEVVEDKGVTILVEPKAVLFLVGTVIDYEVSKLSAKFVFRNPNETDACGCGESVTIEPAKPD